MSRKFYTVLKFKTNRRAMLFRAYELSITSLDMIGRANNDSFSVWASKEKALVAGTDSIPCPHILCFWQSAPDRNSNYWREIAGRCTDTP